MPTTRKVSHQLYQHTRQQTLTKIAEFNQSGFDSSDKVDQPTHPVIFTKRATSIIASGEPILPHAGFTESVDFEGEIGVIIGKAGFRISEADAMGHVWGYTIINDVTARERQRDHKQFYIGKSPDTFCPMVSHRLSLLLPLPPSTPLFKD
jgi:2-keto-4-pentenoate hydratase/2-oxohepta-3-ene-1,7-dioic acid hydratase in catechol pathway